MDLTKKTIPLHLHPLGFINAFTQLGVDLDVLLQSAKIDRKALKSNQEKISYSQFIDLIQCGIQTSDRPGLGLYACERFNWIYHGVVGLALTASSTFNQAGLAFQRYSCIPQPYYMPYRCNPFYYLNNRMEAIIPIEHLITTVQTQPEIYRFEVEFRMGLLFRILKQFGGKKMADQARFELNISEPTQSGLYEKLTISNIRYGCSHSRLILPALAIDTEGNLLSRGIYKQTLEYCDQELRKLTKDAPNIEHVRTLLVENLPHYPGIDAVAKRMEMTPRTLARKLKQEGTSFTDALNAIRSEIAIYLLRSTSLSVDDIAESVGFSETSNFRQAFVKWTGHSSREYRAH
jgi:AraC-like DNA-binding protein